MADTNGGAKYEVKIVNDVGGQSLRLDIIVIALIHSIHGFGLGVKENKHHHQSNKAGIGHEEYEGYHSKAS